MGLKLVQRESKKNYIEVWADSDTTWSFAPEDGLLEEINAWVSEHNMGSRASYNGWQLRGPAFLTAFILRWQPQ